MKPPEEVLGDEQIREVDRAFQLLVNETDPGDQQPIIQAALSKAELVLDKADNEVFRECARLAISLGEDAVTRISSDGDLIIVLASLDYFIDEWDILPDFIPGEGLVDDLYVLQNAQAVVDGDLSPTDLGIELDLEKAKSGPQSTEPHVLITELHGAAGMHFAGRAKDQDLLTGYQRKALYDVAMRIVRDWSLTPKQEAFFVEIVEGLVTQGMLEDECPDAPCKYCNHLERLANRLRLAR